MDASKREAFLGAFVPYLKALKDAGILVARAGLQAPHSATTLRLQGDKPLVQDGPYAETKEQLAGFLSSTCRTSTPLSNGRPDIPARWSKCGQISRLSSEGRSATHIAR
jgi:hypothetical protein